MLVMLLMLHDGSGRVGGLFVGFELVMMDIVRMLRLLMMAEMVRK